MGYPHPPQLGPLGLEPGAEAPLLEAPWPTSPLEADHVPSLAEWRAACARSALEAAAGRHAAARRRSNLAVGTVTGVGLGLLVAQAAGLI
jgi:hypothetical protein